MTPGLRQTNGQHVGRLPVCKKSICGVQMSLKWNGYVVVGAFLSMTIIAW